MYIPNQYRNTNIREVHDFIRSNSFGILVSQIDQRPWASHIPMELETDTQDRPVLQGHLSKRNTQWETLEKSPNVMAIFTGPQAYVSSSWYQEEDAPTWNYIAVHVYGRIRLQSEEELLTSLEALVAKHEQNSQNPVSVGGFSEKTMAQISRIVGFEILIEDIQAAYKLSQGNPEDHQRIVAELKSRPDAGSQGVAQAMEKQKVNSQIKQHPKNQYD